jgi:plastocyanin
MKLFLKFPMLTILLAVIIGACATTNSKISDREYVLTTEMKDGKLIFLGVSDEINGIPNPTLKADAGETITLTLVNGGMGQHDITIPAAKVSTETVKEKGEEASITFTVPAADQELTYYDSVANHAKLGMKGVILVGAAEQVSVPFVQSSGDPQVLAAFQKGACGSCHVIPGIPNSAGVIAPDLSDVHLAALKHFDDGSYTGEATTVEEYIHESILEPNLFIAPKCPTGACPPNVMPATLKVTLTAY